MLSPDHPVLQGDPKLHTRIMSHVSVMSTEPCGYGASIHWRPVAAAINNRLDPSWLYAWERLANIGCTGDDFTGLLPSEISTTGLLVAGQLSGDRRSPVRLALREKLERSRRSREEKIEPLPKESYNSLRWRFRDLGFHLEVSNWYVDWWIDGWGLRFCAEILFQYLILRREIWILRGTI